MRPLKAFMPFFYATVLIVVIFFMPEGMAGLPEGLKRVVRKVLEKKTKHA
jgi:hypothetical protein